MEPEASTKEGLIDAGRLAFSAVHVEAIARKRCWLPAPAASNGCGDVALEVTEAHRAWMERAAQLLGPQATDALSLERILERVFDYDAAQLLSRAENQAILAREGARDVLRELAGRVLDSPSVDSDRFKEIVSALKEATGRRGPELFHPVRLALAGCAGNGEYDRVILLLDEAARFPWAVTVKSNRQRILEFCTILE